MIFVTTGTHNQQFDRLIEKIDKLVKEKKITDEVLGQIGVTNYKPKNFKFFDFCSQEEFDAYCSQANIVVSHGGVGSIMTPLILKKKTIAVPRYKKFGEHQDDHQMQIVKELEKQNKILAVYDIEDLGKKIEEAKSWKPNFSRGQGKIISLIEEFVRGLDK